MDRFARIIVGYHGCRQDFAEAILLGESSVGDWQKSQNAYDWLGEGIYFWEHSPLRALRWAADNFGDQAAVIGAMIQLGTCFDLLDEINALILARGYQHFADYFAAVGKALPVNKGTGKKLRELDCAVINVCVDRMAA